MRPKPKKPAAGRRQLKGPSQIERISYSMFEGKRRRIGGFSYGDIYVGRVRFRDGAVHRVAIKRFKEKLSGNLAKKYQSTINALMKAGVLLPKMRMVKMPNGEWVQVSQLFGSTSRGSKIVNKSNLVIKSKRGRTEAAIELTKVANAGYNPQFDLIEPFRDKRKGIIPIDLDMVVRWSEQFGKPSINLRADFLAEAISKIAEYSSTAEFKSIAKASLETASPALRKALEQRWHFN